MQRLPEELLEKIVEHLEGDEEALSALTEVEWTFYRIARLARHYSPAEGQLERFVEAVGKKDLVRFVRSFTRCDGGLTRRDRSLGLPLIHDQASETISISALQSFTQLRRLRIIFCNPTFAQALLKTIASATTLQILDLSFDRKVEPRRSLPINSIIHLTQLSLVELRISIEGLDVEDDGMEWGRMKYLRKLGIVVTKANDRTLMKLARSMFDGLSSLELVILDDTGSTPQVTEGGIVDAVLEGRNYRSLSVHSYPLSESTGPFMDRIVPHLPLLTTLSTRTHSLTRPDYLPIALRHLIFYQRPWPEEMDGYIAQLSMRIAAGHLGRLKSVTLAGEGQKESVALLVTACLQREIELCIAP